jgi:hypothetical protein
MMVSRWYSKSACVRDAYLARTYLLRGDVRAAGAGEGAGEGCVAEEIVDLRRSRPDSLTKQRGFVCMR